MNLLDELFRSETLERVFSDTEHLQGILDFEAGLARAEARVGVIPEPAARAIAAKCQAALFDQKAIARGAALSGNVAIPVVRQLTELVAKEDKEAARHVHWGATSQDAIDSATVLQWRRAFVLVDHDLRLLAETLTALAQTHRDTPIAARTLMQQALPSTFGFIVAGWLDACFRDAHRLKELSARVLVLQFGGAVGTLAALGERGPAVAEALAQELQLPLPPAPWHGHRDRVADVATTFGICCGSLGKIARDISLHAQTEIGELSEPAAEGRGGSSTMPHKRNPITCAAVLAVGQRVPGLVSTMLSSLVQEQQRGLGGWHAEWETVPEIICLTGGALHHLTRMLPGLEVHADRMKSNLESTSGLIFAEAVTFALAKNIGKMPAHQLVESACQKAVTEKRHLKEVLQADSSLRAYLTPVQLDGLFDATKYSGSAGFFVDQVVENARRFAAKQQSM